MQNLNEPHRWCGAGQTGKETSISQDTEALRLHDPGKQPSEADTGSGSALFIRPCSLHQQAGGPMPHTDVDSRFLIHRMHQCKAAYNSHQPPRCTVTLEGNWSLLHGPELQGKVKGKGLQPGGCVHQPTAPPAGCRQAAGLDLPLPSSCAGSDDSPGQGISQPSSTEIKGMDVTSERRGA